ncbi:MAG: hypothetical protein M0Z92_02965 [Actinomycetota bacterium]|nr:hypothetical protein [Actinomycetota bacterium]
MRYIDARHGRWGVEPICLALKFAPAIYCAAKKRPQSKRAVRDQVLPVEVEANYADNSRATEAREN